MKRIVYVLGNPIEPADRTAVNLIPRFKKSFPHINFVHFDPTEELPENISAELTLIDTVIGIDKVTKFDNLDQWKLSPRVTVHDYDLPLMLGILKKLGKIRKITIIGIPEKGNLRKFFQDLEEYLQPTDFQKM